MPSIISAKVCSDQGPGRACCSAALAFLPPSRAPQLTFQQREADMLPIPTKIKAVREDPSAPIANCYREDTATLAKLFASISTTPPTKQKIMLNMTGYNEHAAVKGVEKYHINGVNASNDRGRLVEVLERLEVITPEFAKPLKTIFAHGAADKLKEVLQISVYKLDAALRLTDATVDQRLAFKASLAHFGLLVPEIIAE